jgi:hypothetical protein
MKQLLPSNSKSSIGDQKFQQCAYAALERRAPGVALARLSVVSISCNSRNTADSSGFK